MCVSGSETLLGGVERCLDLMGFQVGSESKIYSFVTFSFPILAQSCLRYSEEDKAETPNQGKGDKEGKASRRRQYLN